MKNYTVSAKNVFYIYAKAKLCFKRVLIPFSILRVSIFYFFYFFLISNKNILLEIKQTLYAGGVLREKYNQFKV